MRCIALHVLIAVALCACRERPAEVLGTLEYDRVSLPAPVSEPIVAIEVREGEAVRAGQVLLRFEPSRTAAGVEAAAAEADRQRATLSAVEHGARGERIDAARAQLASAQAQSREADAYVARLEPLARRQLVAAADLDRARATRDTAAAGMRAARATLDELERGSREEDIAQARAAAAGASAQLAGERVGLARLQVVAPRRAHVDSLPFKRGDQPPAGATVAILLAGDAPYARVYVPEPMRASVRIGAPATVRIDGHAPVRGRVRAIRSEPVFTPYYALTGDDAARLSYLAEIALDPHTAGELPAGLPVRVDFDE